MGLESSMFQIQSSYWASLSQGFYPGAEDAVLNKTEILAFRKFRILVVDTNKGK